MYKYFMIVLLLCSLSTYAQKTREELEAERTANQKKIAETNRILEQTQKYKVESLSKLNALTQQIRQREHFISLITEELTYIDKEIIHTEQKLAEVEKELKALREEYAAMVYVASKTNNSIERLSFLFSSHSFNELVKRIEYFGQYKENRLRQIAKIEKTQSVLQTRKQQIQNDKADKIQLLATQKEQYANLQDLQQEQSVVISTLKTRESELKSDLARRRQIVKNLDDVIASAVSKIAESSKKSAEASVSTASGMKLTPEARTISDHFVQNKNNLIWPVREGFITGKFGTHPHPVFPKITVDNLGVDIRTHSNETVRAVFPGKVAAVNYVQGSGQVVVIQHGEYFTVYARLKNVGIKAGDKIKMKDVIGVVETNTEGVAEVQFQIWKNQVKLDPEEWLAR